MDIEFSDLNFKVSQRWLLKKEEKVVLKQISGRFRVGELSAIMGPSGAGKSSLLNAVSGFRKSGVEFGGLFINGKEEGDKRLRNLSCYIMQEDLLQPLLTLQEQMFIAASLKLPTHYTHKQKLARIDEVLDNLGLSDHRHTNTEKLSGGQRKRVSIALELINNPPIVFLDEPTSGLDIVSGYSVICLLRRLAVQGRTVVCTVHQPSAKLFSQFHHVYVLSMGMCVYQGPTRQLVPFLSSYGLECPTTYNPADYVIEMTDRDHEDNIYMLSKATCNGKLTLHTTSTVPLDLDQNLNQQLPCDTEMAMMKVSDKRTNGTTLMTNLEDEDQVNEMLLCKRYEEEKQTTCSQVPASFWNQFTVILHRMFTQIIRNKFALHVQFWHHIGCSVAVGIIFFNMNNQSEQYFTQLKFCIQTILFHVYTQCIIPVLLFPSEVKLVKREVFNKWYSINPYFLALTVSKIPTIFTFNWIYLSILYFMTGIPFSNLRYLLFCFNGIMVSFIAEGYGYAIGSIFNITNGSAVAPLTIAPMLGFAVYGFDFVRDIPWYLEPILKTSFMRVGVVSMTVGIYGMDRENLSCNDMYCYFRNPKIMLHYLNVENQSPFAEFPLLIFMLLFYRFLTYAGLSWRLRR